MSRTLRSLRLYRGAPGWARAAGDLRRAARGVTRGLVSQHGALDRRDHLRPLPALRRPAYRGPIAGNGGGGRATIIRAVSGLGEGSVSGQLFSVMSGPRTPPAPTGSGPRPVTSRHRAETTLTTHIQSHRAETLPGGSVARDVLGRCGCVVLRAPVFFVRMGLSVDASAFGNPETVWFALASDRQAGVLPWGPSGSAASTGWRSVSARTPAARWAARGRLRGPLRLRRTMSGSRARPRRRMLVPSAGSTGTLTLAPSGRRGAMGCAGFPGGAFGPVSPRLRLAWGSGARALPESAFLRRKH
jgi:hypothetical protein